MSSKIRGMHTNNTQSFYELYITIYLLPAHSTSQRHAVKIILNLELSFFAHRLSSQGISTATHRLWLMANEIHICEYHGDPPVPVREYVIHDNEKSTILRIQTNATGTLKTSSTWSRPFLASRRVFSDLFLPVGYPSSVGPGYAEYQVYDSIQGLCSYLRGVVATSAVLTAAGVGDAEATAMSAAVVRTHENINMLIIWRDQRYRSKVDDNHYFLWAR
eukprot:scaffold69347_cov44-Attheya_sp.AAC.3